MNLIVNKMSTFDEFLCRVTRAGVPHSLPMDSAISTVVLQNVDPSNICQAFWLLESLQVSYTYVLNGYTVNRSFTASTTKLPKDRIIAPAIIYHNDTDYETYTDYHIFLDFSKVYYDANDNDIFGLKLELEEADAYDSMNIGFYQQDGMLSTTCQTTFLGKNLTLYLNYNPDWISSASISNFSLTPTYFELD